MFELFVFGQLEQFFSDGELAVDFVLCEAEVGYVEEACLLDIVDECVYRSGTNSVNSILELSCEFLLSTWEVELG